MKKNYLTNTITELNHRITGRKKSVKNTCVFIFTIIIIGIGICSCKKDEPEVQEISPSTKVILSDNSIELAKWAEGKASATTIATALRAYAAENDMNIDYENITVQKLFDTPYDLQGKYFNIDNYELSDVSFDHTRSEYPLRYTITINSPDESWKIKSFQLLHTGQWIQKP